MKPLLLLATAVLSAPALAQTTLPPGFNHPPMAGHPAANEAASGMQHPGYGMPRAMPTGNEGTVISTQTSGGYTYIEVSGPSGSTWLAAPASNVKVGNRIRYQDGAVMRNFSSKALGRSFPTILFVGGVTVLGNETAAQSTSTTVTATSAEPPPPGAPVGEGVVVSSQDAGGYSYIEVKSGQGNTWLAVPMMKVKAGDTLRYETGSVMRNFSSRALGRTFPSIVFVERVTIVGTN